MSEILENVREFTAAAIKQADKTYRVARLKLSRAALNRLLAEQYVELGKMVYTMRKSGTEDKAELASVTKQIDGTRKRIAAADRRIGDILGLVKCPKCGAVLKMKNAYCSYCGKRLLTEEEDIVENENEMNVPNE